MLDWVSLIEKTLKDLGGESMCVPGAKLHAEVSKRALKEGAEFAVDLRDQGITFRQYLEPIDSVIVHLRPGADMLVGFHGASLPTSARRPGGRSVWRYSKFREDVYSAFTRITATPFVYIRKADRFTTEPGDETGTVDVPPVTLEGLVNRRRIFVESLENDEGRDNLERSIKRSANPLADFQRTVIALSLSQRWHDFNYKATRNEVETWAKSNGLEVSEAWFSPQAQAESAGTTLDVLLELARHMTEDEIRALAVPFRAVEELYRALPHRRRP